MLIVEKSNDKVKWQFPLNESQSMGSLCKYLTTKWPSKHGIVSKCLIFKAFFRLPLLNDIVDLIDQGRVKRHLSIHFLVKH